MQHHLLSATEFINIDEDMVYDEETTAKEIVDTVRGIGAEEEESEELNIEKKVSGREALDCVTSL